MSHRATALATLEDFLATTHATYGPNRDGWPLDSVIQESQLRAVVAVGQQEDEEEAGACLTTSRMIQHNIEDGLPVGYGLLAACLLLLALALPAAAVNRQADRAVVGVNVNTATTEQLAWLPGVGPAIAERIVAARGGAQGQRFFGSVMDLCGRVKGLGGGKCRDIAPYVLVGRGPTTATGELDKPVTVYTGGRTWYVCPAPDPDGDVSHVLASSLPCSLVTD